jgi:hypothetical protein
MKIGQAAVDAFIDQLQRSENTQRVYGAALRRAVKDGVDLRDADAATLWAATARSLAARNQRRAAVRLFLAYLSARPDAVVDARLYLAIDEAGRGRPSASTAQERIVLRAYVEQVSDPWSVQAMHAWLTERRELAPIFADAYPRLQAAWLRTDTGLPPLPDRAVTALEPAHQAAVGVLLRRYGNDAKTLASLRWRSVDRSESVWLVECFDEPYFPQGTFYAPDTTINRALRHLWHRCEAVLGRQPADGDLLLCAAEGLPLDPAMLRQYRNHPAHLLPMAPAIRGPGSPVEELPPAGQDPFA